MLITIALDGKQVKISPDQLQWEPPPVVDHTGQLAPILGRFWSCRLSLSRLTVVQHHEWAAAMDGEPHTIALPHPTSGAETTFEDVYVEQVAPRLRFDGRAVAMAGVDVLVTHVEVD